MLSLVLLGVITEQFILHGLRRDHALRVLNRTESFYSDEALAWSYIYREADAQPPGAPDSLNRIPASLDNQYMMRITGTATTYDPVHYQPGMALNILATAPYDSAHDLVHRTAEPTFYYVHPTQTVSCGESDMTASATRVQPYKLCLQGVTPTCNLSPNASNIQPGQPFSLTLIPGGTTLSATLNGNPIDLRNPTVTFTAPLVPGVYTYTATVLGMRNQSASCSATVTVQPSTYCTLAANPSSVYDVMAGENVNLSLSTFGSPVSSDLNGTVFPSTGGNMNGFIPSYEMTQNLPPYPITRTYQGSVTDASGRTSQCNASVAVEAPCVLTGTLDPDCVDTDLTLTSPMSQVKYVQFVYGGPLIAFNGTPITTKVPTPPQRAMTGLGIGMLYRANLIDSSQKVFAYCQLWIRFTGVCS